MSAYFIIFRRDRTLTTARLVMSPQNPWRHFQYDGRVYKEVGEGLSNGDHFVNTNGALVGFSFILGGDTALAQAWHNQCDNVEIESDSWLKIYMTKDRTAENDRCQCIYPIAYHDGRSDFLLLVDECPQCWSSIGFEIATAGVPEPVT